MFYTGNCLSVARFAYAYHDGYSLTHTMGTVMAYLDRNPHKREHNYQARQAECYLHSTVMKYKVFFHKEIIRPFVDPLNIRATIVSNSKENGYDST